MDFFVAGLGFGAMLVFAGCVVREYGVYLLTPGRIQRQFSEHPELADAWRRFVRRASNTAIGGGCVMWLAALVAVAVDMSDTSGATAMAAAATTISLVGAALVALAFRRLQTPAMVGVPVSDAAATRPAPHATEPDAATGDVDAWMPRIVGKATATIADDMPAWGATYLPDEPPAPEPAALTPEPTAAETPVAAASEPAADAASTAESISEPIASETPAESPDASKPPEAEPEANAAEPPEPAVSEPPTDEASGEGAEPEIAVVEPTATSDEAKPDQDLPAAESESQREPEPALEPADNTVPEPPAGEPADVPANGARRFRSSLLADIDEPVDAGVNAKFKSAILADLSSVRLPDDGPRFRSTVLIDAPKPADSTASDADETRNDNRR